MADPKIVMLTHPRFPGSLKGVPANAVEKFLADGYVRVDDEPVVEQAETEPVVEPKDTKKRASRAKKSTKNSEEE